ncbi:BTAD domain-containing putative transcriptional regulator [Actinoplanes sp. NEAU-A12]|uniref:BTAD domain-containing putative transcriptional regulator n=1 Tax=Actinoplanes sandaracinus TaxID=3045177 RepID=A0ABT6X2I0_9ACTN|nr:BTAD domain-containing putative transcriptional regulator [Actinoplanes sandaracinus]MDI6106040.1 BTAD domain-containing putative transcriptional regulator [Actinoplanes sandaracinus]
MVRALATVGRLLRALAALAVLAGFMAGVPWLLTASAGWPLGWIGWPQLTPVPALAELTGALTSPWSDQMILGLLASIGWVLWLIFVRHVIVEVIEASADAAVARRGQLRAPVTGRGPIRWVAAVLVGAIVGAVLFDAARAVTSTGATTAAAAADAAARRPAVAVAPAPPAIAAPVAHTGPRPAITVHTDAATARPVLASTSHHDSEVPAWARDAPGGVHRVKAGDNLWELAEEKLGDPHRWREIYKLNRGHEQANGYALTDPDEIHVGWTLAMPARDTTPAQPDRGTPAPPVETTPPDDGVTEPGPAATPAPAASTPPPTATPSSPASSSASAIPPASASAPAKERPSADEPAAPDNGHDSADDEAGISLPSDGWVSLGLAALIAAVASLLRLQRRRRARLSFPIPARIGSQPTPVPEPLAPVDAVGARHLPTDDDEPHRPVAPAVPTPIGLDPDGAEVSLFDLPGPGLALTGDGAEPAARAVLAAALATGATQSAEARPVVVTTTETLARLLPAGAPLVGLDRDGTSYDGERLIVLSDAAAAVTHAEEEMIVRRRLLDTFDLDSITALNERTDHAEAQPPYVLLIEATGRHAARLRAVGAHRPALHLHPVILGGLDGLPAVEITADGTPGNETAGLARLSILTAGDLAAVLTMLTDATARPEPGHDIDLDPAPSDPAAAPHEVSAEQRDEPVPAQPTEAPAPVRLRVLGPVLVETETGAVATGMRSGSYTVLASLAVHPGGRTLDQLAADLHPDTNPGTAGKRIRTDISTTRRVLRAATGNGEAMFVVYDAATGRYRLDPDLIAVDLWQMLTAIEAANTVDDDTQALALLREAAELYGGDFADGADQPWITDYATTYRHQVLSVFARIAEIVEADHPDQAIAALERALEFDPVNEELYQRIMRIHGRAGRPDAVRRTLRRLEERLADLGGAEPSQATRRVAERQLRPATVSGGHR